MAFFNKILNHWGLVMHTCAGTNTNIGSDNGLSPGQCQAITWTNAGILLIGPLGTNFSGILSEIHTFSFKRIHLKMSSCKWRPFCLGLNVLSIVYDILYHGPPHLDKLKGRIIIRSLSFIFPILLIWIKCSVLLISNQMTSWVWNG